MYEDAIKAVSLKKLFVTPEQARGWVEASEQRNRPIGWRTVERYQRYMTEGQWRVNGEPLIFSIESVLLDGQHRLHAVIKSGLTIPMLAIEGISPEEFKTINQGRIRTGADTLATMNQEHAKMLSSALVWMHHYESETIRFRYVQDRLNNQEIARLLDDFPGMAESVAWVGSKCKRNIHSPALFAFLHHVCSRMHPLEAEDFFLAVFAGTMIVPGSPIHKLTDKLTDGIGKPKTTESLTATAACVIKAFNATLEGKTIRSLRWTSAEEFPTVA